jgi:uncharacterized membrane protein YobD (UPF0266 family)
MYKTFEVTLNYKPIIVTVLVLFYSQTVNEIIIIARQSILSFFSIYSFLIRDPMYYLKEKNKEYFVNIKIGHCEICQQKLS